MGGSADGVCVNPIVRVINAAFDYAESVNALDAVLRRRQWFRDHQQLPQSDYEFTLLARCGMDAESDKEIRVCISCDWRGVEGDCMDYKHATGARLCPECYDVTEKVE